MKKIEINSLTLIADDNGDIIGGYGFCDNENAKAIIDKMVGAVAEMVNAPKSLTCCSCHCESPCEDYMEDDCADCEWETCPECGGDLRVADIGRAHILVHCMNCGWETER